MSPESIWQHRQMTWEELTGQISALLEPWETGPRQGGDGQWLWCGSYVLVRDRLPHLPQVWEDQPPNACIDLTVEREGDRVTRVDFEGYSLGETLARLGLVRQAQEYAAAVPGPVEVAGPALLTALRRILEPEDVHGAGEGTYRLLGTERPTGSAVPRPDRVVGPRPEGAVGPRLDCAAVRPDRAHAALFLPGGPLLDSHYLGDLGGAADLHPFVAVDLPRRRVDELEPVVDSARDALGLDRVDLVAHSAGAALALAYLAARPDRVHWLVLVCPAVRAAGVADDPDGVRAVITRRSADEEYAAALAAVDDTGAPVDHPRLSFGRWSEPHEALAVTTTWDRPERLAVYYAEPRPDTEQIRAAAADFPRPVTVLHGELDLHPTVRQAEQLAALFPHGEAVELRGAAHYPWLDDAEAFGQTLLAALRR